MRENDYKIGFELVWINFHNLSIILKFLSLHNITSGLNQSQQCGRLISVKDILKNMKTKF